MDASRTARQAPPAWVVALADRVERDGLGLSAPPVAGARPSAVLMLFGEGPRGPDVLLIQRADQLRAHAGQPAFPGGAADPGDANPADTALREAAEEVGVVPAGVDVLTVLEPLFIAASGYAVTPVLGWWADRRAVGVIDPVEVAAVSAVPIADLADPARRCRVRHSSGRMGPGFDLGGMLVWGFTAMVLDRLLELGGWTRPWEPASVREIS